MKLDYPATGRNRDAILEVLRGVLPPTGTVVEVASGSGQHTAHFSADLPALQWQPTDIEDRALASIRAWCADRPNVREPLLLDVLRPWPLASAEAVLCCNMIHIAPWACTLGLLAGAARLLPPDGPLFLYGPFQVEGTPTTESNAAFDRSLRGRDPSWGIRDLGEVEAAAAAQGFTLERTVQMPANNLSVVLRAG